MTDSKTREFDDKNQRQQMQERQAFTSEPAPRPKEDYATNEPPVRREDPGTQSGARTEANPHREQRGKGDGGDLGEKRNLGQRSNHLHLRAKVGRENHRRRFHFILQSRGLRRYRWL